MVTVFWDIGGVILMAVMARGETVNSDAYIKTLQKLNAQPHTSLRTEEAITKFGWTVLPNLPNSPDLAPSDFHLFALLKDTLSGIRFEDDESVIRAVRTWLHEQEMRWYREGMHALVSRRCKAVDVFGDYVEK